MDDIFVMWEGEVDEFVDAVQFLEGTTQFLRFTYKTSNTSIDYLDITLYFWERETFFNPACLESRFFKCIFAF